LFLAGSRRPGGVEEDLPRHFCVLITGLKCDPISRSINRLTGNAIIDGFNAMVFASGFKGGLKRTPQHEEEALISTIE
jgi:hypothetical protein